MRHRKSWEGFSVGDSVLIKHSAGNVPATITRIDSFLSRDGFSNQIRAFTYTLRTGDGRLCQTTVKHFILKA